MSDIRPNICAQGKKQEVEEEQKKYIWWNKVQ